MNDTITVCGIIATEPRHLVTDTGIAITSMRLASPSRRWDRGTSTWTNGATNWYSVTAFRTLAANVHKSVKKGDRVVVTGRVRIRSWERDGRGGTSIEIDAEGIGHDLAWGISNWIRVPRHASESSAAPGATPTVDPRTGEVHTLPGTASPASGTGSVPDAAVADGALPDAALTVDAVPDQDDLPTVAEVGPPAVGPHDTDADPDGFGATGFGVDPHVDVTDDAFPVVGDDSTAA
jgi:single-strand DNA-binding protein